MFHRILVAADIDLDADLIVIGTPGNTNMRDFLGGVNAQVLRHTRCPVLQVR